jgi:hypothetical protein
VFTLDVRSTTLSYVLGLLLFLLIPFYSWSFLDKVVYYDSEKELCKKTGNIWQSESNSCVGNPKSLEEILQGPDLPYIMFLGEQEHGRVIGIQPFWYDNNRH